MKISETLTKSDIINSLRFYIMLGFYIAETKPESKDIPLNNYISDLLDSKISNTHIKGYIEDAINSLPYEFNKVMQLDSTTLR